MSVKILSLLHSAGNHRERKPRARLYESYHEVHRYWRAAAETTKKKISRISESVQENDIRQFDSSYYHPPAIE